MALFCMFVLACMLDAVCLIWGGYVASILWGWFIVPHFGLPELNIPVAIGMALTYGAITQRKSKSEGTDKEYAEVFGTAIGQGLLGPLVLLMLGAAVNMWM